MRSRLDLIRRYAGDEAVWPPTTPLWHHASGWWTQWDRLGAQFAGLADDEALAVYVEFDHALKPAAPAVAEGFHVSAKGGRRF